MPCSETWMHKGFWTPKLNIFHYPDSMLVWNRAKEVWIMQFWAPPKQSWSLPAPAGVWLSLPNQFDCDTAAIYLAGLAQDIMNAYQKYKEDLMEGTCEV